MTGYVRKDTANNIADGNVVNASDLDNEFDGVVAAFNNSTGHSHGGATGEGAPILTMGPTQDVTVSATLMAPKTTNTVDIGSTALKFKDLYLAGAASLATLTATAATTASSNLGAFRYGTLGFSDTGIVQSMQTSVNSYFQNVMQNTSAGAAASAEFIAYNDQGTASTNYATVGINSSGYSGTGSINAPGYGYFLTASTDLVLGTIGANGIHFTTNSSATDALAISSAGAVSLPGGTANGVSYLNASKVLTTGSALTWNTTNFSITPNAAGAYTNTINLSGSQSNGTKGHIGQFADGLYLTSNYYYDSAQAVDTATYGVAGISLVSGTTTSSYIAFGITAAGGSGLSEQMRLTSTGLGIGTSSPAAKLHVYGSATQLVLENPANTAVYAKWKRPNQEYIVALDLNNNGGRDFTIYDSTAAASRLTLDSSGNLGLGVTPSAWSAGLKVLQLGSYSSVGFDSSNSTFIGNNWSYNASYKFLSTGYASYYFQNGGNGQHQWFTSTASGTAGNAITFTQAMSLDASGNLLVGTTSAVYRGTFTSSTTGAIFAQTTAGVAQFAMSVHNNATSGDNALVNFGTEVSLISRGSITYNRGAGLVAYNVTSDYRAKDIIGPVTDSGALIDSVPVYTGKMKGATQERPMFIAHETPSYAHTGEKDAVDAHGNPVYQQMDASALVPVMWAEIQSLRQRLAALESK